MSNAPAARRPSALVLVAPVLAILLLDAVHRLPILSPDAWWHLATGRWIAAHGVPHVDPFAWAPEGRPWIAHEWLADRIAAAVEARAGLQGVVLQRAALVVAAFAGAFALARRVAPAGIALPLVGLAAWASQRNWLDRPQLWSYVLLPVVVLVLERDRVRPGRVAWMLPPLFALWVNLHGGFMLGLGLVVVWQAADAIAAAVARRPLRFARRGLLIAACAAATLANPFGVQGAVYPLRYVGAGLRETVHEERAGRLDSAPAVVHFGLVLLAAGLAAVRRGRVAPPHLAVVGLLAWISMPRLGSFALPFAAERHAPLFLVGAVPLVAGWIAAAWRMPHAARAVAFASSLPGWIACAVLGAFGVWQAARGLTTDRPLVPPGRFPVQAAAWMRDHDLPQRVLDPYRWGGYLMYALGPERCRVWVDSRGDFHGAARLREDELLYRVPPGSAPAIARLLSRDAPDVVVWFLLTLDFGRLQVHPFARLLLDDPGWRLVYFDGPDPADRRAPWATSAVFVRVHPGNAALLERLPAVQPPSGLPR